MDKFNIFIHFPTKDIENEINTRENLEFYFNSISFCIYRTNCEKGSKLYYSEKNISEFLENIKIISDIGNYEFSSFETLLFSDYLSYADNWEDNSKFDNSYNSKYYFWNFYSKNKEIQKKIPEVLKEIAERKLQNPQEKYLLLNIYQAFNTKREFIPIIKDELKNYNQNLPQFIHIQYVNNFIDLEKWFRENRRKRKYNFEDNRHLRSSNTENSKTKKDNKSPILNNDKQHIAKFLDDAIGYANYKNYLINFDEKNKQYISSTLRS